MKNIIESIVNAVAEPAKPDTEARLKNARALSWNLSALDATKLRAAALKEFPQILPPKKHGDAALPFALKYAAVHGGLMELCAETPGAAFKRQRQQLTDLAKTGDAKALEKLRDSDAWTRQDLHDDRSEKRHAYKTVLRSVAAEAHAILFACDEAFNRRPDRHNRHA